MTDDDEVTVAKSNRAERAMNATANRIGSRLPPTVAWKNGGSGPMICDRAAP